VGEFSTAQKTPDLKEKDHSSKIRILKFIFFRLIILFVTVVVGVYLTILIANMGGYVDDIRRAQISHQIALTVSGSPQYAELTTDERRELIDRMVAIEEERLGMDRPFLIRSFSYLSNALTLDLGRAEQITSDSGSRWVRQIIKERLAPTLLLFATSYLIVFFSTIFIALFLSRRYGSKLDKLVITLAPTSAAPSWFYGIFLILIFSAVLGITPFGGMVKAPPPDSWMEYGASVIHHMILPLTAMIISVFFITIYSWRTFFLIYSSEDYVDMAKAKGLPSSLIERRYILRPTLPTIITNFALSIISLWMGSITLEMVFNWPGLGSLFFDAVGNYDTPIIVATAVIYAYLLGITVFLLDILYALVDPRVKVGGEEGVL